MFRLLSITLGCKLQKSDPILLRKKVTLAQVTNNPRDSGIAWSRTPNHAVRIPLLNFSPAFFCIHCIPRENLPRSQESNFKQVQLSSVAQSCLTLRLHGLQHARPPCPSPTLGVPSNSCPLSCDVIQPPHPLSSPSLPTFNLFQHQGLFKWVSSSHQVAKVLEFQLQHQCFQWIFRTDFL